MAPSIDDQDDQPVRDEPAGGEGTDALLRDTGLPLYLREIGAVALLTAAEEQALAVDRGREVRRRLAAGLVASADQSAAAPDRGQPAAGGQHRAALPPAGLAVA